MTTADFAGFRRIDFNVNPDSPMKEAEAIMKLFDFKKVEYNCVYEGPVARLVAALRCMGWIDDVERMETNPYLLVHPDCFMTFNYAESMTQPSAQFIAYFRG